MGVHSVHTMCTVHPHTAAPLVVTALPRVITHGREKTKENAYYMGIYRKQAHTGSFIKEKQGQNNV